MYVFCVSVCTCGFRRMRGDGGYILVMLTEFYKLWLTPLPTADWILNKQSQVAELSRVSVLRLENHYFTSAGASLTGPPHQPVLFLASAVERGRLWGGVLDVVYKERSRGSSHLKRRRGDGWKLDTVREKENWRLLLVHEIPNSNRGKLGAENSCWLSSSCGFWSQMNSFLLLSIAERECFSVI